MASKRSHFSKRGRYGYATEGLATQIPIPNGQVFSHPIHGLILVPQGISVQGHIRGALGLDHLQYCKDCPTSDIGATPERKTVEQPVFRMTGWRSLLLWSFFLTLLEGWGLVELSMAASFVSISGVVGPSSNHMMRCTSAHSLLTCGLLDWLMVVVPCGGGHDWHWQGRGSGPRWVCLDLDNFWGPFATCFSLHECQRPQEGIASRTHLQHPATNLWQQDTPWVWAVLVPGIQEWLWAHQIIKSV